MAEKCQSTVSEFCAVCMHLTPSVCVCVCLPQGVDIKHWWLQLSQLYGCDAHGPNVTQLVVAAFDFHCCNLWCHPEDRRGQSCSLDF